MTNPRKALSILVALSVAPLQFPVSAQVVKDSQASRSQSSTLETRSRANRLFNSQNADDPKPDSGI